MRTSNGKWLYKRRWQKVRSRVICLDKNDSTNLLDVELRRLEIGTDCNRFLMYRGSADSKDLWANKHILNSIPAFTAKKWNSIAHGVFRSQ